MEVSKFFTLLALSILTKLSSSVDDVAWLLPYINSERSLVNATVYSLLMQAVVWTSVLLSFVGKEAISSLVDNNTYWTAERVLGVASGVLLTLYSIYLFWDWYTSDDDDTDNDVNKSAEQAQDDSLPPEFFPSETAEMEQTVVQMEETTEAVPLPEIPEEVALDNKNTNDDTLHETEKETPTTTSLVTVALLGSMDDLSVFFGLLLAGTFEPASLSLGVLIGSGLVLLFCKAATFAKPAVWCLERVPLWVIIGCFAAWTFVSAFAGV